MNPFEETFTRPDDTSWAPRQAPNACCLAAANLTTIECREEVQVRRCQVCGRRHFRAFMPLPGLVTVSG